MIKTALSELVEGETAGNPMSAEKWLRSSLRHLSERLQASGHRACPKTVGRLLKGMDYSLKANVKRQAGAQHPDRNTQFEYIEAQKQLFLSNGWPIISIDAKKKELIGNFTCACGTVQARTLDKAGVWQPNMSTTTISSWMRSDGQCLMAFMCSITTVGMCTLENLPIPPSSLWTFWQAGGKRLDNSTFPVRLRS
jgi:hypothetical protein